MRGKKKTKEAPKRSYIRACPQCSSRNLVVEPGISVFILFGWIYQYRCRDCGYFGPNYDLVEESEIIVNTPQQGEDRPTDQGRT